MQNLPAVQEKVNSIRNLFESPTVVKELKRVIPKHLTVDRMLRVAMTSIQRTPALLDCTPRSLLGAVMMATQLGLEVDQFLGQAYLVPFKNKGRLEAQLIPGYRGYIALARRSGEVQTVSSQVVYQEDHFILQYGLEDKLEHRPAEGDRGEVRGAYVVFRYKDGSYSFDYMPKPDIDAIRQRSKAKDSGPWVTDYAEMAKKTVIKRHAKLAPMSIEFQHASALEDMANSGTSQVGFFNGGNPIGAIDTAAAEAPDFDKTIPEGTDLDTLKKFLALCADQFKKSVDDVKAEAALDPGFWDQYQKWAETQGAAPATLWGEAKSLRKPGFADFVHKNIARIKEASDGDQDKLQAKWIWFYEEPWPLEAKNGEVPKNDGDADWNGLVQCPNMNNENVAKVRCKTCDKREGCPSLAEKAEVRA